MSSLLERARALAIAQDFGAEACELNRQLVAADPADAASRTRLGRCHLEAGRLDEAEAEYREALRLDPKNRIAAGGLEAVERHRHLGEPASGPVVSTRSPRPHRVTGAAPRRAERAAPSMQGHPVPDVFSGFDRRTFGELQRCPRSEVQARFAPRVLDLLKRVNALVSSKETAAVREAGRKQLFRVAKADVRARAGHWAVASMGATGEPRFDIGMYAGTLPSSDWLRIGLGFNLGADSFDDAAGARAARDGFRRFQAVLASPRRSLLLGWMIKENGLVQLGERDGGPRLDLREPARAVEQVLAIDPDRADLVFAGKWLSPSEPGEEATLADPVSLVRTIDRVVTGLLPLWRALWER